jgi:hypothetical protein
MLSNHRIALGATMRVAELAAMRALNTYAGPFLASRARREQPSIGAFAVGSIHVLRIVLLAHANYYFQLIRH